MGLLSRKPAERPPTLVLLALGGNDDLWAKFTYPLGPGEDIVGRDEGCSIQIGDPQISRQHLAINYAAQAGGFVARDLGSVNGTMVNGQRLEQPVVLSEGDLIELGNSRLLFTSERLTGQVPAIRLKRFGERQIGTLPGEMGGQV
jgi:hypothetical protein